MEEPFDYLIVGGGAAGCVLAARLTENPRLRICLIEAGRDVRPGEEPDDIRRLFPLSTFNDHYTWPDLRVHWRQAGTSPSLPFQQGRLLGGSSQIMGMWALRGVPEDYDGWAADGAQGWGWDDVLPYFRKLETDVDFGGPLHGDDGPLPIRRRPYDAWSPIAKVAHATLGKEGWTTVEDMNADFRDGHCRLPISRYENSRASAGISYLTAAVRARSNLTLLTNTTVLRIEMESGCAVGAHVREENGPARSLSARETILCAGAIHTPALLLRSGVGPGEVLQARDIQVHADRPGVGRNLQNHPFLPIVTIARHALDGTGYDNPPADTYLRWTSDHSPSARGDLGLYIRSYLVWHALGRRLGLLAPVLMKPKSTGTVKLDPGAIDGSPLVEFNFFTHEDDLPRMIAGLKQAMRLAAAPDFAALYDVPLALSNAGRLGKFNNLSKRNAFTGWLGARCFDLSLGFGRFALSLLADMTPISSFAEDDDKLREFVLRSSIGTNHVVGTCRMGSEHNPASVVDTEGRVVGLAGLRIADASVMPSVPSGNTHLPTVMVAEKIADAVRRQLGLR